MNIANRITFWAVLASLIVLIPTSWFSYQATWNALRRQFSLFQPVFSHAVELNIVQQNAEIETLLRMAAYEILAGHSKNPDEIAELFHRCLKEKPSIYGMIYASPDQAWYLHRAEPSRDADRDGSTEPPPVWRNLSDPPGETPVYRRNWYTVPEQTKKIFCTPPYPGRTTDVPMITFSMPILDEDGIFRGVVACDVTLDWINRFIGSIRLARSEVDQIFLLDGDGTVLADKHWEMLHKNIRQFAESRKDKNLRDVAERMLRREHGEADYRSPDGKHVGRIVFMPINDFIDGDDVADWSLGVFVPRKAMRDYAFRVGRTQTLIGLFGAVLLLVAIRLVARGISRPIQQLHEAALTIASGNLDAEIPKIEKHDEVGDLAESFEQMQHKLKEHIASLAAATRQREQIESELRIARRIQMSLVPKHAPETPYADRFDLAASMEPAKQVGGDFYDFFMVDEKTLCLVIADVSGKGIPGSLLMTRNSAVFHGAMTSLRHPGPALETVNREMVQDNDACMFVTMFALTVDLTDGTCRYANAGHNPPFIVRKNGTPELFDFAGSLPVGIDEDSVYEEKRFRFESGDMIYLYTDGVTEAIDGDSNLFGERRTGESLDDCDSLSCDDVLKRVRLAVNEFVRQTPQSDDITMVALRWR